MTSIAQPPWLKPAGHNRPASLHVYNSLTKKKEEFVPNTGKSVGWYACGPTVYDKSHLGHARNYITTDIIRRILTDYFGFNVLFVMNITDIDDKIIIAARQKYLFDRFYEKYSEKVDEPVLDQLQEAWTYFVQKRFPDSGEQAVKDWDAFQKTASQNDDPKHQMYLKAANESYKALFAAKADKNASAELLTICRDILSFWLDAKEGSSVTDPTVFRNFAAFWENEYFNDMDALNIKRPDMVTRVSEYVPEIVDYVQKIVENGYAYETDGSVYFDTIKFDRSGQHSYAKLEPWSAGNMKLLQEGEGALSESTNDKGGKRNPADFALWKKSKPGEPEWDSLWGRGRPGWHIECSTMASEVLGESLDIHSGGIDLAFPHHDNELAQSEGYYNCKQWVNYFLHTGHLHIEGQKMSKSLKNFISIKEALEKNTASQIRIMFLLYQWDAVLDYNQGALEQARLIETSVNSFLSTVKSIVRQSASQESTGRHCYRDAEKTLMKQYLETEEKVHQALCDSFNTPTVMQELRQLISSANIYLKESSTPNPSVVEKIAIYVTKMFRLFGVFPDVNPTIGAPSNASAGQAGNLEEQLWPYVQVLSSFRDTVRELAQKKEPHFKILDVCDSIRDNDLPELGVALEDQEGGRAIIKFVDKEVLLKQKEEKAAIEAEKARKKEEARLQKAKEDAERLEKAKIVPSQMFRTEEYSEWDENGIPTKDKEGEELPKSRRKKLEKEYAAQKKLHDKYFGGSNTSL